MNLKQHNDIVQKLLLQIETKDKQLSQTNKQLSKQIKLNQCSDNKNTKPTSQVQIQKQIQKRISQLNKQHINKVNQLNQEIKTLTNENLELKQRLALKNQLQSKQKQHIVQVMKKNWDRKAGTQYDHKVGALISHYQQQLTKKNNYIETLKRQIKSLSLNSNKQQLLSANKLLSTVTTTINHNNKNNSSTNNKQRHPYQQQFQSNNNNEEEQQLQLNEKNPNYKISILQHKNQINQLQSIINKSKLCHDQKCNELKDLKLKYNQLTKQYYRIVNQYGINTMFSTNQSSNNAKTLKSNQANKNNRNNFQKINSNSGSSKNYNIQSSKLTQLSYNLSQQSNNPLSNLLQEISSDIDGSISINFEDNFKRFNKRPQIGKNSIQYQQTVKILDQPQTKQQQNLDYFDNNNPNSNLTKSAQLIQQILQLLNISNQNSIIPYLTNLLTKINDIQLYDNILKKLHSFFYSFGMGKVSKTDMLDVLDNFEDKCNKWIQSNDLLDQICIQIGAKKVKLLNRIQQFKLIQKQYLQKMKNIEFLVQLNKSQKIIEFINFFKLDQSNLQLPQQLKNIYQQLKYVDKFIKQANMTLNVELKDSRGLEGTLELILRKLQKYSEWESQLEKQNNRKKNKAKSNKVIE